MDYSVSRISGNSFIVKMVPVTLLDKQLLSNNTDAVGVERHYHKAIAEKLGEGIHIASLTPHDDYPYSATIEVIAENGSAR